MKPTSQIIHILAHPTRLGILQVIATGEKTVGDIARAAAIPRFSASQHLKILRDFDIVTFRRDGNWMYYRTAKPEVGMILKCIRVNVGGK